MSCFQPAEQYFLSAFQSRAIKVEYAVLITRRLLKHCSALLISSVPPGVNGASERFFQVERRYNYTTPKTFLELIKLYKNVLAEKRRSTQEAIDRLDTGLNKLNKTQAEVDVLVEAAKKMAVEVEAKVANAEVFAEQVAIEKEKVNAENAAAQIEADKCAVVAKEVSEKQASCEADLAAAEPLVAQVGRKQSCRTVVVDVLISTDEGKQQVTAKATDTFLSFLVCTSNVVKAGEEQSSV